MSATIEGLEECLRALDKSDKEVLAVTKKAMRAGGNKAARALRTSLPEYARLIRSKVSVTGSDNLNAGIGLFNVDKSGSQSGNAVPDWFKAYWKNYGTLEGRDPNHQFESPVKHSKTVAAKRRKGQAGIQHQNFYEKATVGIEKIFLEAFQKSLDKNAEQIL